jgi:hypothetical protein
MQRIVVEVSLVVIDAGDGQHDVGRVEGELSRRHAHAVAGNALEASDGHHLASEEAVGVSHRHRCEPAGLIGQVVFNRHLPPVWRVVRR